MVKDDTGAKKCLRKYTIAELLSDAGYATALFGKWHLGDTPGWLPNDQGYGEWWGVINSWDETAYTARPLFKESGVPVPMIWEGKSGQPSTPVMPLDLHVRPIVDEQYIIPKTIEYIRACLKNRQGAFGPGFLISRCHGTVTRGTP